MEGKQYFSLVMYGFCSNNTFYSASPLSFMVFIFVLTPFDTWDWMLLFWIKFYPGKAHKIFTYNKKHVKFFCSLLNIKE